MLLPQVKGLSTLIGADGGVLRRDGGSGANHMSMLKARMRWSRSPMLAAWKSSGWSIRERAMRSAAQMLPDITCCASWLLRLFLWRLSAVRKLLAASLHTHTHEHTH